MNGGRHIFIGFKATAISNLNEQYDANFLLSYPVGAVSVTEINNAISATVNQFLQMHPSGSVLSQMERVVNIVSR